MSAKNSKKKKNTTTKNYVNEMRYKGFVWVNMAEVEDHWWLLCKRE
jgi:hypothetical protein